MRFAHIVTASAAITLVLAMTACSSAGAPSSTAAVDKPSATATPIPTIDPGPVELTTAEAVDRYLNIVCPQNATGTALDAAFKATEDEFFNGGAPDMTGVKAAAQAQMDATQVSARLFDDKYFNWPGTLGEQIQVLRNQNISNLGTLSAIVNAPDYQSAYYAVFPDGTASQAAAQEIRYQLGISADTQASCAGYEGGHDKLQAEQKEREEKLAAQKS